MTKSEYKEIGDVFAAALCSLQDVEVVFVDDVTDELVDGLSVEEGLKERGSWLNPEEYRTIKEAIECLERLTGRAHARSV